MPSWKQKKKQKENQLNLLLLVVAIIAFASCFRIFAAAAAAAAVVLFVALSILVPVLLPNCFQLEHFQIAEHFATLVRRLVGEAASPRCHHGAPRAPLASCFMLNKFVIKEILCGAAAGSRVSRAEDACFPINLAPNLEAPNLIFGVVVRVQPLSKRALFLLSRALQALSCSSESA